MKLFEIVGKLFIDDGGAEKKLQDVEKQGEKTDNKLGKAFGNIAKGAAVIGGALIAAGGAMYGMAVKAGENADRLLDLKAITGMSTDEIQRWEKVTKIAGVSTDAMTNASQKLTKSLDTMIESGGKGANSLEELGLSIDDVANMNADERMDAITHALAGVENTTLRAKLGTDLLGGSWKDIAPIVDMGSDAMDRAKESANIIDEDNLNKANDFRIRIAELKDQFGHFAMMLGITVIPIIEKVMTWFGVLIDKTKAWYDDNEEIIAEVKQTFTEFFAKVADLFKTFIALVTAFWDRFGSQILAVIKSNLNTMKAVFSTVFNLISDIFKVFAALFRGDWSGLWEGVKNLFSNLLGGIKDIFSGTLNTIMTILKEFNLFQVGKDIIQGLINGIRNMIGAVGNAVKDVASNITGGFKKILGINSPSKVFAEFGKNIGEGLELGIDDSKHSVEMASRNMAGSTISGVAEPRQVVGAPSNQNVRLEIPLIVDGHEIARACYDDLNRLFKKDFDTTAISMGIRF